MRFRMNGTRIDAVCYLDFITYGYVALINWIVTPINPSILVEAYHVMQIRRTPRPRYPR